MKAANRATITVARSCFYWGLTQQPPFHICVSFIPSISAARAGCYRISYSASNRIWSQRLLDDCKYLFAPRVQLKINFRRRFGAESRALTHSNRIFHPFLPVLSWKRASSLLVFGPILKVFAGKSKKEKPENLMIYWLFLAERVGFEPTVGCPTPDFES